MDSKSSIVKNFFMCEELIIWMVGNYKVDGMITRDFIDEYYRLCDERGIVNVIPDTAISKHVKKRGFVIVDKKISGIKLRLFQRK